MAFFRGDTKSGLGLQGERAVRKLLADTKASGVGKKYLIQHSAGSGKSNSIAWIAHQLIGLDSPVARHPVLCRPAANPPRPS